MMRKLMNMRTLVVVAAMLGVSSALPASADEASDRAALDTLFGQLKAAANAEAADLISQQIWQIWTGPSDKALADRMKTVMVAEQSGDLPGAMTLLKTLVVDYPSYAEGWNQRATIEYQLHDFAASLADIDKVLALEPRHFGALSGKVLVYLAQGDRTKALAAMLAALAVDPYLSTRGLFPELSQPAVHT
jgi:tetratricopeptide (TPR) repeat protein